MGKLQNKVAVVTGGSSGIGAGIAKLFLEHGAKVTICGTNGDKARAVADDFNKTFPGACVGIACDVAVPADMERLVKTAVDKFGRLDVMVNNAGYDPNVLLHEMDEETFDRAVGVNFKGVWLGMKYAALQMMKTGGGSLITISSWAGAHARLCYLAYGGAKAAANHGTAIAALELAKYKIRANVIAPGAIITPMNKPPEIEFNVWEAVLASLQPIARCGQPRDIAEAALYFASDDSSFVTGQVLGVDGGGVIYDTSPLPELIANTKAKMAAAK